MKALVLSGGGARGAYQVGALRAVGEIAQRLKIDNPFQIYTGVSAGALNASFLAAGADQFPEQIEKLVELWSGLTPQHVFRTDIMSLGRIGLQWVEGLSLGGLTGTDAHRSLLDTSPLRELIERNTDFARIAKLIDQKKLVALAVTSLDYQTSTSVTFVQGQDELPDWSRSRRRSVKASIRTEHILGSSAIPLLFPPVAIDGSFFGDGCVRNLAPMSPAIHLGADQLFVIGVRRTTDTEEDLRTQKARGQPSVARVLNVLMNAILLDGIELDIERLNRINGFVGQIPENLRAQLNFKMLKPQWLHPSDDIGLIAKSLSNRLPRIVRYLLKGLGPLEDAREIISYLLFDPKFCSKLIEIGYRDGMQCEGEIQEFLLR